MATTGPELAKLVKLMAAQREILEKLDALADEIDAILGGNLSIGERLKAFEAAYDLAWCARYAPGEQKRYVWNYARDRVNSKRLLMKLGDEEVTRRAQTYLKSEDPFFLKNRHPFGLFISSINTFASSAAAPVFDCRHQPPCHSDHEHTSRRLVDARSGRM